MLTFDHLWQLLADHGSSDRRRLAQSLDNAIRASVGIRGLNTLIYGWLNLRHYGPKYRNAIYNRDWLYVSEVQDLSDYAGYDLLTGQRLPDK